MKENSGWWLFMWMPKMILETSLTKSKITCLPLRNLFGKIDLVIQKIPFLLPFLKHCQVLSV